MAMHNELWFPSVVWSSLVHVADNVALKKWIYEKKRSDQGRVLSNINGWQSQDLVLGENEHIDRLTEEISAEISSCCQQVGLPKLRIYNSWINVNPPGAYNQLHNHIGAIFSGVYYISVSPNQGNLKFQRSDNAEYHLPETIVHPTYFNMFEATYAPKNNALLIFPGWLKHSVEPNMSNHDRISFSFNYGI